MALCLVPEIEGRDAQLVADRHGRRLRRLLHGRRRPAPGRRPPAPRPLRADRPQPDPEARRRTSTTAAAPRAAAAHLIALGHRRFGVVLGYDKPHGTALEVQRATPYHVDTERLARLAGRARGRRDRLGRRAPRQRARRQPRTGRAAAGKLLDRPDRPTAILALTDVLALGALEAAAERGLAVPGDLSVAGFDDMPEAARSRPLSPPSASPTPARAPPPCASCSRRPAPRPSSSPRSSCPASPPAPPTAP